MHVSSLVDSGDVFGDLFLMSADQIKELYSTSTVNPLPASGQCNLSGEHWRWCPRCGHELHNEKCKLRCPQCHYFLSCSDFD